MNFRQVICVGLLAFIIPNVFASIQTELDRKLVEAAQPSTGLSIQDILFERRCEMIEKYLGYDDTAISRAIEYSCQGTQIGVALYIGADLGDYPPEQIRKVYVERFNLEGLEAEVFIQEELEHGSNVVFFINGESYLRDRIGPVKGLEKIRSVTAEAKLIYLHTGQSDKYILSEKQKEAQANRAKTEAAQTQP